jgi:nicotinamidase/pyrazinamidase
MSRSKTAYLDVDTQRDFMVPSGALYVQGARAVAGRIRRLVAHAAGGGMPLFSSVDAHAPDDPEFGTFPGHCVVGTRGQEKIAGTLLADRIAVRAGRELSPRGLDEVLRHGQVILEKQSYDVFDNPNTVAVLRESGAKRFVVFGVATDYCVRAAVLGLRKLGYPVTVVEDAIRGVAPETTARAIEEMRRAGARFRTTDQVLGSRHV